jgi:hypothetical protein
VSLRKLAAATFLLAWFVYFTWGSLAVHFGPDDMMNMSYYWRLKPAQFVTSHFLLWRNFYRPMGGVFYLPLLHIFGLNPAPFHAVILALLLANVYLVYRLAILLRAGGLAAGLAALVCCYHAGLSNLTYNIGFVYDVLCGFFYLAAMVYYLRIRGAGRRPRGREMAVFLVLFVAALNSKEMAVTLPVVLLVYEWLYQKEAALRAPFWAALLNLPYLYGKTLSAGALASNSGYRAEFSWARIAEFQSRSLGELFLRAPLSGESILWLWAILFYLAFRRPRPALRFCWAFLLITPLPIEFLQGRGSASLYIPFIGWAIFLAIVCVDLASAAAEFLAAEPVFGRAGKQPLRAILLIGCIALWAHKNDYLKRTFVKPSMEQTGALTSDVLQQLQSLRPRVRPHTSVVFLRDPFAGWDMAFITELYFQDRSLNIKLQQKTPLSNEELARVEHVFDYSEGRLVQLR